MALAQWHEEKLLILVKTYPGPSSKHREITCVAAINEMGQMRRVFPVPFRLLEGEAQFKKWEWIKAKVSKATDDHRPESYKIDVDTLERLESIKAAKDWQERKQWLEPHLVEDFEALEIRRQTTGETLGVVRPTKILGLDITQEKEAEWTEDEKIKLTREGLFDAPDVRARKPLRKLPFAFHYRYQCEDGPELRHKITDWEAGALYWNCVRLYGANWEEKFRQKLELELPSKDLMFLMGTIHRFPNQWLIVGLIYPPKPKSVPQMALNFE
jgi:hypothetical protein